MTLLSKIAAYVELTKPRILTMVLVTTALGFFLGKQTVTFSTELLFVLLGVGLACGGVGALNHSVEWKLDQKMQRTRKRPIPQGVISPVMAIAYGVILTILGVALLAKYVNLLAASLVLLTALLYVCIYTPMKRVSWYNTVIGAIPGAIPPMVGWVAATGELSWEAWLLFGILFAWQHPHFYAIAWIWKDDYAQGGFQMLPVIDPHGQRTFRQVAGYSLLLLLLSLLPTVIGMTGFVYLIGAIGLGIFFGYAAWNFIKNHTVASARKLLKASVIYLPALLLLISIDVFFL